MTGRRLAVWAALVDATNLSPRCSWVYAVSRALKCSLNQVTYRSDCSKVLPHSKLHPHSHATNLNHRDEVSELAPVADRCPTV